MRTTSGTSVPTIVGAGVTAVLACFGIMVAGSPASAATHRPAATVRVSGPAAGLVHHAQAFAVATTLRGGDKARNFVMSFGDKSSKIKRHGTPPKSVRHTFGHTGVFTVTVKLRDVHGKVSSSTHQLTIDTPTGTYRYYAYSARISRSYQAGPFVDEYGKPLAGDLGTALKRRGSYGGCPGFVGPQHTPDGGVKPDIYINRGKKFTDPAGVTIPAHTVFAHPGTTAKYSPAVRFENPSGRSEAYTAKATITSLDGGGGDGVAGFLYQTSANGKVVNAASNDGAVSNAPPSGSTPSQTFTLSGTLPAHGSIFVVIGNNGTYNYDTAGIALTVKLR